MLNRPQQLGLGLRLLTRDGVTAEEAPAAFDAASVTGLDYLVRHCALFVRVKKLEAASPVHRKQYDVFVTYAT